MKIGYKLNMVLLGLKYIDLARDLIYISATVELNNYPRIISASVFFNVQGPLGIWSNCSILRPRCRYSWAGATGTQPGNSSRPALII